VNVDELCSSLFKAFPRTPITRAAIDDPEAIWDVYDERADLASVVGKTWDEIEPASIVRHDVLLIYAADELYRLMLPAYLHYLLRNEAYNEVPFHVAGQLTRKNDPAGHARFEARVGSLTNEQRSVVREMIVHLSQVEPMQAVMRVALSAWDEWRTASRSARS
jgi:hypothetical protein